MSPHRAPPAASHPALVFVATPATRVGAKGCPGVPGRACAAPRSAGRLGRARSALRQLTWEGVFEWHERSECNELPDRPRRTSIAGQSTRSGDRRSGAHRHTRTALCRAELSEPPNDRKAPQADISSQPAWLRLSSIRCDSASPPPAHGQRALSVSQRSKASISSDSMVSMRACIIGTWSGSSL